MLGWPITVSDLRKVDDAHHCKLMQLNHFSKGVEDVSLLCLDFTMTHEVLGVKGEIKFVQDGAIFKVTNDGIWKHAQSIEWWMVSSRN